MRLLVLILVLFSIDAFACVNFIAKSDISDALNQVPNAGNTTCVKQPGHADECICFDGIDFRSNNFTNGQFVIDPAKEALANAADAARNQESSDRAAKQNARNNTLINCAKTVGLPNNTVMWNCIQTAIKDMYRSDLDINDL